MHIETFLNRRLTWIVALAASLSSTACGIHLGDSTAGDQGVVDFQYSGFSCLFGCDMKKPILVGTKQQISANGAGAGDAGVDAVSTDPSVATFTVGRSCDCEEQSTNSTTYMSASGRTCQTGFRLTCENHITVQALAPGEAGLDLRSAGGTLIDRTTVTVAQASSVTLHDDEGSEIGTSVSMQRGDDMLVSARLVDAEGRELLADEGVSWGVLGSAVSPGLCLLCSSNETELSAARAGHGAVTMSAAGVSTRFDVDVAP